MFQCRANARFPGNNARKYFYGAHGVRLLLVSAMAVSQTRVENGFKGVKGTCSYRFVFLRVSLTVLDIRNINIVYI